MKIHRDSPHHVPAHVVAFHRLRRLFGVRPGHVLHKGVHHPVNAHWHKANTAPYPHLAGRSRHELRGILDKLMNKSNSVPLTKDELAYLRAANNHFDVRTAINFLGGRHHSEFGFDGVDQVHGQTLSPPCGCKLAFVFDHHKTGAELHPHHPHAVCDVHASHAHDLERLHAKVTEDNQRSD